MTRGALGLIWDACRHGAGGRATHRVGGESTPLPQAKVWIVADELPMRIAMYAYTGRMPRAVITSPCSPRLFYLALAGW